ncbi:UDPGP type 1 family protein [Telmatocola sphagniphila]|uniref:UDPGP type 1 family protein n=1 Tax=Telmatocola sphagniphila TaxID=1123043 RepID=A0A8E6B842_9BACT|nr:UDPGP type 1 family protein [Telmatocola sphagniphila]QVL32283.1 UDPGP type 1 family protein [Telmatocola sphagniphila]
MRDLPPDLFHRLTNHRQEHLLLGWEKLTHAERLAFINQIAGIDLSLIDRLYSNQDQLFPALNPDHIKPAPLEEAASGDSETREIGHQALSNGELAVLLVAGGQGSRLGFDKPKGMYPVGPISNKTLFQIHVEKVFALRRRYTRSIPLLVMTSPATHTDTEQYFEENNYFGLPKEDITFFQQGTMPSVEIQTGRLLLEKPGLIFTSPNGHGGTLTALSETGLLDDLKRRGTKHLFYFQVDNPLVKICDPAFVGRHVATRSELSSKAIAKEYPKEKMGVFALINGRCNIVEYSDLPDELANARSEKGDLLHKAGSPAIHIFEMEFLERITRGEHRLPFHVARKKVPCLDANGHFHSPTVENALKFEMFIFDSLPLADRWLLILEKRREEFAPLKNATGEDSPEAVRQALSNLAADWCRHARLPVPVDKSFKSLVPLEISPRFAMDAVEFAARVGPVQSIDMSNYWE